MSQYSSRSVAAALIAISGALQAAPVQQISISDLTDGPPTFTTALGSGFISSSTAVNERLTMSGDIINLSVNNGLAFTRTATMLQSIGGPVSDFITLVVQDTDCSNANQTGHCDQLFSIVFESDDYVNFAADLAGRTVFGSIVENGNFQELSQLLVAGINVSGGNLILSIMVRSDLDVPEPASLALVGAALAGLALCRRRASS